MSAETEISTGAREREIFLGALEKTSPVERGAFIEAACGDSHALRQRVEELLHEHQGVGDFLEKPAVAGEGAFAPNGTEKPGDRIGRYKLLQKIGEGGAGVVYMAEQEEPVRRRVALKVIKLGMDTKSVIARFEAERQALAMMDHPNIAKVLDAGATETGRPFFVMELVRGIKITEYCDQNQVQTEDRLKLFISVCQAIQHAHQKGIIHRDIKPSNILVTLHDGNPVPKVIDFGIAKATEHRLTNKTFFTEFTTFIGTPAYMSPEQAEMSGLDIDTRSDIYSLGVLLYELLTGKTPFDAETLLSVGLDECRRTIREAEPARPSTRLSGLIESELTTAAHQRRTEAHKLIHLLQGDLDWIAMKCLEKDRTRRYPTANSLATDVQHYLNEDPVSARPPSSVYQFQKFVRRHRGAFAAAAAISVTLVAGAGISAWQALRALRAEHRAHSAQIEESQLRLQAEGERTRAEQGEAAARLNEYVADINLAQQSLAAGNLGRAVQLLNKHRPQPDAPDLRGFEWRYLWHRCQGDEHIALPTQESSVQALAVSPGGEWLAVGLWDKLHIFNLNTKALVTTLSKGVVSLAFTPDGHNLISASTRTIHVWNTRDWAEEKSLPENTGPIALSPDGKRLATVRWDGVRIWDTSTWKEFRRFRDATGPLAFSPDSKRLVTETGSGLTLWPLEEGQSLIELHNSTNLFGSGGPWFRNDRVVAFSPDGKSVIAARNTLSERGVFVLGIWDAQSGREVAVMPDHLDEHTGVISGLAFSPDGNTLATASMDYSVRLWDFRARKPLAALQGHLNEVWTLAFSPDGQSLISGAKDGSINLWPLRQRLADDILPGPWQPQAFSKDSRLLVVHGLGRTNTVSFINLATREAEQQIQLGPDRGFFRPFSAVALSADCSTLVQGLDNGTAKIWDVENGETTSLKVSDSPVDFVSLSPDGHALIAGGRGRALRWWDLRSGTNALMESDARRVLFSPDGRLLAAFAPSNTIELWDVPTRSLRTNLVSDAQLSFPAAFSPDGRNLAVVCFDDVVRLWDTTTCKLLGTCTGHKQAVFSVAFSADGKTLATASDDSTLKLWHVATQQELLTIRRLGGALRTLVFSPDGRWLAAGSSFFSQSGLRLFRAPLFDETESTTNAIPTFKPRLPRPPPWGA